MEMTKKQAALIYNEMVAPRIVGGSSDDPNSIETGGSMAAKLWDAAPWVGTTDAALNDTNPANYNIKMRKQATAFLRQMADALDVPDELELIKRRLNEKTPESAAENADLRNVIQAACIGGLPAMAESWAKYFPDHPLTINHGNP